MSNERKGWWERLMGWILVKDPLEVEIEEDRLTTLREQRLRSESDPTVSAGLQLQHVVVGWMPGLMDLADHYLLAVHLRSSGGAHFRSSGSYDIGLGEYSGFSVTLNRCVQLLYSSVLDSDTGTGLIVVPKNRITELTPEIAVEAIKNPQTRVALVTPVLGAEIRWDIVETVTQGVRMMDSPLGPYEALRGPKGNVNSSRQGKLRVERIKRRRRLLNEHLTNRNQ